MYVDCGFLLLSFKLTQFYTKVACYIFFAMFLFVAIHKITIGFLDKLSRKKDKTIEKVKEQTNKQHLSLPIQLMHLRLLGEGSKDILRKVNQCTNKIYSTFIGVIVLLTGGDGNLVLQSKHDRVLRYCIYRSSFWRG